MSYELHDFEKDVLERSEQTPVLVDFWAPWCGPCKMLSPMLEKLAAAAKDRWVLVEANTDEHPELAQAFDVRSIPNVKLFHKGQIVDEFVGALPEPEIRRWLEKNLPSPHATSLVEAERLLREGRREEVVSPLSAILEAEPDNDQARLLLAEALFANAPQRAAELLAPIPPESDLADRAAALQTLARCALAAEHPEQLPVENGRAEYLRALQSIRATDYAAALEALIEVLNRNRDYASGGAQEAGKAIFQFLGIRHPIAERFYRAFSSALHA